MDETIQACFEIGWVLDETIQTCFELGWVLDETIQLCFELGRGLDETIQACFEIGWGLDETIQVFFELLNMKTAFPLPSNYQKAIRLFFSEADNASFENKYEMRDSFYLLDLFPIPHKKHFNFALVLGFNFAARGAFENIFIPNEKSNPKNEKQSRPAPQWNMDSNHSNCFAW